MYTRFVCPEEPPSLLRFDIIAHRARDPGKVAFSLSIAALDDFRRKGERKGEKEKESERELVRGNSFSTPQNSEKNKKIPIHRRVLFLRR